MLIVFRADASARIGLGHLRRCLSLASVLQQLGAQTLFMTRRSDVDSQGLLSQAGQACVLLNGLPAVQELGTLADAAADAQACIAELQSKPPALLVVDHYGLDASWHQDLRTALNCEIAVVDDLANRMLSADALIDQNLCPDTPHTQRYAPWLKRAPRRWFCGPKFALLGQSYSGLAPKPVAEQVSSIGIFLGGTDPLALSSVALAACREIAGFRGPIEIVSTSANPKLSDLIEIVGRDPLTRLSIDLPDLSDFYARHDIQIGAAGGAAWERCAVGVPSLTLCLAENQKAVLPELQRLNAVLAATGLDAASIAAGVQRLLIDTDLRRRLSDNSRVLVDGLGARKVAIGLLMLARLPLQLRPAVEADAECMWRWRNHPSTRRVSRHSDEIPLAAHQAWLKNLLAAGKSRLYLAHLGSLPVGVVRFDELFEADTSRQSWEVSLYLDPMLQGLGLGRELLGAGETAMAESLPASSLSIRAEVLPGNESSLALFRAAGYSPAETALKFIKDLPVTRPGLEEFAKRTPDD